MYIFLGYRKNLAIMDLRGPRTVIHREVEINGTVKIPNIVRLSTALRFLVAEFYFTNTLYNNFSCTLSTYKETARRAGAQFPEYCISKGYQQ